MEFTNSIGDYNILTDFELSDHLIMVRKIDFWDVYKYKDSKILGHDALNHESSKLVVVEVIKQGKDCKLFNDGEIVLVDMMMLSQLYFIFERYHTIDPDLFIAPEKLFLGIVED